MPRPGVFFLIEIALIYAARQFAANAIATAYHAVTLGYGPDSRDVEYGRDLMKSLRYFAPD